MSGPVGSGKSSLAKKLADYLGATHIKTNALIEALKEDVNPSREDLQAAGDALDSETDGRWVGKEVFALVQRFPEGEPAFVIVDAVRIKSQVHHLRAFFSSAFVHIHLTASIPTLDERYKHKESAYTEAASYEIVRRNPTEHNVEDLAALADAVIDTDRCTQQDVFARVIARLGYRPATMPRNVDVLVGGQYGSEGKGNIAHYLAPEYDILVRVGGPNAGHKVFRRDDSPFTFHHIPSGAISNPRAKLVLGAGTVIGLPKLLEEIAQLSLDVKRLMIDRQAMIINDKDVEWEQKTLKNEISSTAKGVGAATARKILGRRLDSDVRLAEKVPELQHFLGDTVSFLSDACCDEARIMLEGTQGTSLSIHHGFYPHVTSRVTSAAGCLGEAGLNPMHVRRVIMVTRTYPIRVGDTPTGKTSGHMSRPIEFEAVAERSGIPVEEIKKTEVGSVSGVQRRIAEFDWHQFRRSIFLNGATDIALTFADYLGIKNREAYRYDQLLPDTRRFIDELEHVGGIPVSLISTAFEERNVIDRRGW